MVIDDFGTQGPRLSEPADKVSNQKTAPVDGPVMPAFASPIDHLAAAVADLILFAPLATFATASLRREITMAQIAGETNRYLGFMGAAAFVLIAGLILYQTVFIAIWGQTPGKRVLRLKVISIWQERITWTSAFLRAVFWCLGLLCLGLPWLSIYSDARRRSLHDKVADTMVVVADGKRAAPAPNVFEQSVISGFRLAVIVFGALVLVKSGSHFLKNQTLTQQLFEEPKGPTQLCEDVTAALPGWMGESTTSRINVALSLYAADRIQDDCLEKEATHGFLQDGDIESSYIAKSILHQDDEKIAARYKEKVCGDDPKGSGCRLLTWLQNSDSHDSITPSDSDPTFLKIWAIKANIERHQSTAALSLLSSSAPHLELAYFYASNRLQALRELNQGALAQVQFKSVLDGLNRDERWDLARDACLAETTLGCTTHISGCQTLGELARKDDDLVTAAEPELAVALIHGAQCSADATQALADLKSDFEDGEAKASAAIALALTKNDTKTAHRLSQSLVDSDGTSIFSTTAWSTFVQTSTSPEQLHHAMDAWSDIDDDGVAWRGLGWQLAQAYLKFHKPEQTLRIGEKLMSAGFSPPDLQKDMVIAAYEKGHDEEAKSYLAAYETSVNESSFITPAHELAGAQRPAVRGLASVETNRHVDGSERDARFAKALRALGAHEAGR